MNPHETTPAVYANLIVDQVMFIRDQAPGMLAQIYEELIEACNHVRLMLDPPLPIEICPQCKFTNSQQ